LREISRAVEEALKEEMSEMTVIEALERMISTKTWAPKVIAVKPKVKTLAEETIREMRESASSNFCLSS